MCLHRVKRFYFVVFLLAFSEWMDGTKSCIAQVCVCAYVRVFIFPTVHIHVCAPPTERTNERMNNRATDQTWMPRCDVLKYIYRTYFYKNRHRNENTKLPSFQFAECCTYSDDNTQTNSVKFKVTKLTRFCLYVLCDVKAHIQREVVHKRENGASDC